mmetsp:Transcript_91281/g.267186  ORF Transcript_91281/g.267186 Transcript_91281/m.267186 type:complete len:201 (+) Transcript_91281:714-1316(+)
MCLVEVWEAHRARSFCGIVAVRVIHALHLRKVHQLCWAAHSCHVQQRGVVLAGACRLPSTRQAHLLVPPILAELNERVACCLHGRRVPRKLRQSRTCLTAVDATVHAAPWHTVTWEHAPCPTRASVEGASTASADLQVELVARHVMSSVHRLGDDVPVRTLHGQPEAGPQAALRVVACAVGADAQVHGVARSRAEGGLPS